MFAAAQPLPATEPSWLGDATLDIVRPHVRRMLQSSPGYRALPPDQQLEIARNMVRVASYMANPEDLARQELTPGRSVLRHDVIVPAAADAAPPTARALANPVDQAKGKASEKIGTFAGSDFEAGSVTSGAGNFKNYIGSVDFPAFVGGLIQNVFQAIVDASIQQMTAYGELLKSVSQSIDQFADDNISLNNARDWLVEKFPGDLILDTESGSPLVGVGADVENPDAVLARMGETVQLAQPLTDLSDPEQEARLVQAARLQMARSRQQLLSSMVILGINRIVVTDGMINAKVVFDFRASDTAKRNAGASLYDNKSSMNRNKSAAGVHFGWGAAGSVNENVQKHMTTVSSSVNEESESKQDMKAKLSGEVRVNFKSDYFPMEKLASPGMIAAIQGNSTPVDPNIQPNQRNAGASAGAAA